MDFVVEQSGRIIPIEVKYMSLKKQTVKRSLRSFIEKYSPKKAFVINLDYQDTLKIVNTEVQFLPYYQLLELTRPLIEDFRFII